MTLTAPIANGTPRPAEIGQFALARMTLAEAADAVRDLARSGRVAVVVTPNIHHLTLAENDRAFRDVVRTAELALADGWPVVLASRLLRQRLPARVAGIDLVARVLASDPPLRVAVLGGPAGAADAFAERFRPTNEIVLVDPLPAELWAEIRPATLADLRERLRAARPNLVLVGVGAPKQELLAARLRDVVEGPIICCGAAIEVLGGLRPRAPKLLQRLGLEWAFRLMLEPRRLGPRYLSAGVGFTRLLRRELKRRGAGAA
jgi:N-acetylglucosaminyldiphosphoundecaprenol N-acetyl-beta-D-mannosaminyltransferase